MRTPEAQMVRSLAQLPSGVKARHFSISRDCRTLSLAFSYGFANLGAAVLGNDSGSERNVRDMGEKRPDLALHH